MGSLQFANFVIRFCGNVSAIVRSFEIRLRWRLSLPAADRQVSSGLASIKVFTRSASCTILIGGAGSLLGIWGNGMSKEA